VPESVADLILRNAKVTTLQNDRHEAQAFPVRGEKIVAVGDDTEVEASGTTQQSFAISDVQPSKFGETLRASVTEEGDLQMLVACEPKDDRVYEE
jgi:hypothetical protein